MNELPVDVKYMVYFLRRFLKVQLTNEDREIAYAAFRNFDTICLTDSTMVGDKSWKELKAQAMQSDYMKWKWVHVLDKE